jgi:Putative outer membrane beta-barrel porin, MtrB/PioB
MSRTSTGSRRTDLSDTVQTAYAGVKAALVPKVLDLRIDSAFSNALGRIETRNPTTPVSGTAAQNATTTAKPFPAFQDTRIRVEASLIYYFLKNWSARVGYAFEKWDKTDFRTDTLNNVHGRLVDLAGQRSAELHGPHDGPTRSPTSSSSRGSSPPPEGAG